MSTTKFYDINIKGHPRNVELVDSLDWQFKIHSFRGKTISGHAPPCKLDATQWKLTVAIRRVGGKPEDLIGFDCDGMLCSSEMAEFLASVMPNDCQRLPVEIVWPKTYKGHKPTYEYVNCHREVDAANLSEDVITADEDNPDPERFRWRPDRTWLDPSLVPGGVHYFQTKYVFVGVIVSEHFAKAIRGSKFDLFTFGRAKLAIEDRECRKLRLAWLKRRSELLRPIWEAKQAARARLKKASDLETALKLKLPEKVAKHFESDEPLENVEIEFLSLAEAVDSTQELRTSPDLSWPKQMVCIASDGRGGFWVVDATDGRGGKGPVFYFDHELSSVDGKSGKIKPQFEKCKSAFASWLKDMSYNLSPYPRED